METPSHGNVKKWEKGFSPLPIHLEILTEQQEVDDPLPPITVATVNLHTE